MAICVWTPKYKTRQALVDVRKVKDGKNYLFFAADKSLPDLYSFDGGDVLALDKVYNGRILCYGIPIDSLKNEGELPEKYWATKAEESKKYKNYLARIKKK